MEQRISYCSLPTGERIAYSLVGSGPVIVAPPPAFGHLELEWENERVRRFWSELAGKGFTVVRYDGLGVGLSGRERRDFSFAGELSVLEGLINHLGAEQVALFADSRAGPLALTYAARQPRRISHLVLYGTGARPDESGRDSDVARLRKAFSELVYSTWGGFGSRVFAQMLLGEAADEQTVRWLHRVERASATPEAVVRLLDETWWNADVRPLLAKLEVPALVMHRRGDLCVSFALGRELGSLIPGARFVALDGNCHLPWFGDSDPVIRHTLEFLGEEGLPTTQAQPVTMRRQAETASFFPTPVFEKAGECWTIGFLGRTIHLRDSKGLRYLARLLADPGREVHCLELASEGAATAAPADYPNGGGESRIGIAGHGHENPEALSLADDAGELLDARARLSYRRRIDELERLTARAQADGDGQALVEAVEEIDFLRRELARAQGLGSRVRKACSRAERARLNVTRAIHCALARIDDQDPELGALLSRTVKTGVFCCFRPRPSAAP